MASYKSTELGQVQQTLNALNSKKKRRSDKAAKLKAKVKLLQEQAIDGNESKADASKLSRAKYEFKHALADIVQLDEEIKHLKSLQKQKQEQKKKQSEEIFNDVENADAYLQNLCGLPDDATNGNAEQTVPYVNM